MCRRLEAIDATAKNLYNPAVHPQETEAPPPALLVAGHYREQYGYAVYRPHGSGNWLITYTLEGHGLYRQPGLAVETSLGDLVLLQPSAVHDYAAPPGGAWEFLWAHFHPRPAWLSWWHLPEIGRGLFVARLRAPQIRERARQAFLTLHADARAADALQGEARHGLAVPGTAPDGASREPPGALQRELALNGLEEVLLLAVRENVPTGRRPLDPRVERVLGLISHDLAAPHTPGTLAGQVGLSPSRLAHLFKNEIGDSVTNTVLTLRLRQAARLLEYTSRRVGAIAEEVGFSSAFYFSRQFHRHFGLSPRAYRARMATTVTRMATTVS